ncbi:unnamed protein product [Schistocephalus solidus]|uniref:Transmembrane protein n=1 Tax=Schistocephalus solidus TaxID=70667 RepID=A0A183SRF1_SCHSO|nr:unnamed protein product [Schistocephalus solidus]
MFAACPKSRSPLYYLFILGVAVIMPGLVGLDDFTYYTSPLVTTCSSGTGQFNPFIFPSVETEYRNFKTRFHALTSRLEPCLELISSSMPPGLTPTEDSARKGSTSTSP